MGWFSRKGPAPGSRWEGSLTYTTDPLIGREGYYALEDDHKTIREPHVMLTFIDEAPGDPDNGAGHWVVADPKEPYYSHAPAHLVENVVSLEAHTKGASEVSAS